MKYYEQLFHKSWIFQKSKKISQIVFVASSRLDKTGRPNTESGLMPIVSRKKTQIDI